MPILLKMNLACNFNCQYCYEHPIRPEEQIIDHEKAEETIRTLWEKQGGQGEDGKPKLDEKGNYCGPKITLHGGEPTILPREDFEKYLALSYELTGSSGIQTNGYLIDDDMIQLFKKYRTHVGFSIDGPWPLNELRGSGSDKDRKRQTKRVLNNIKRCREEGISCSVIAVIHKHNGLGERRELLKLWVKELDSMKISGRLNPCCCGNSEIDLTPIEAVEAYTDLFDFMMKEGLSGWSPFKDVVNSLKGEKEVVCVFRNCDPFCTNSATSVLNDGSVGVCLRLYGDGKKYLRAEQQSTIRSDVLRQTDCKDCKWWPYCYGGCSGLSKEFDWRNKDRYCELYKALFEKASNVMRMMRIPIVKGVEKPRVSSRGGHWDGNEHIDGDVRHLDSDAKGGGHWDGIEHVDGDKRHVDSG